MFRAASSGETTRPSGSTHWSSFDADGHRDRRGGEPAGGGQRRPPEHREDGERAEQRQVPGQLEHRRLRGQAGGVPPQLLDRRSPGGGAPVGQERQQGDQGARRDERRVEPPPGHGVPQGAHSASALIAAAPRASISAARTARGRGAGDRSRRSSRRVTCSTRSAPGAHRDVGVPDRLPRFLELVAESGQPAQQVGAAGREPPQPPRLELRRPAGARRRPPQEDDDVVPHDVGDDVGDGRAGRRAPGEDEAVRGLRVEEAVPELVVHAPTVVPPPGRRPGAGCVVPGDQETAAPPVVGSPAAAQAEKPPMTSVARCRPRERSASAARLEV